MVSVESLVGVSDREDESFVTLIGVLYRNPSDLCQLLLEDGSGQIMLDVSGTVSE